MYRELNVYQINASMIHQLQSKSGARSNPGNLMTENEQFKPTVNGSQAHESLSGTLNLCHTLG